MNRYSSMPYSDEEIEEMLAVCEANVRAGGLGGWSARFVKDIAAQYEIWKNTGAPATPLSYTQAARLHLVYKELAHLTKEAVQRQGSIE